MWLVKSMSPSAQQAPEPDMTPNAAHSESGGDLNFAEGAAPKLSATGLNFFYGAFQALNGISMKIYENRVTAFIEIGRAHV